jgi:hypothetical protein
MMMQQHSFRRLDPTVDGESYIAALCNELKTIVNGIARTCKFRGMNHH